MYNDASNDYVDYNRFKYCHTDLSKPQTCI